MQKIVLVDVDGTLTKVGDRVRCLESDPPDWDSFYDRCGEDAPVREMIDFVNLLSIKYRIILCSGRRESCRQATVAWLKEHGISPIVEMIMRKDGDFRHDTIVKPEMLERAGIGLGEIEFVLEDRDSMVKKWREMGLICLQVADGNF